MNEHDLKNDVDRSAHAQRLLNDELLKAALAAIESEVVEQWTACPARDKDGKEALWQLMKTAQKFRALLQGHIESGKLAAHHLKAFEEKKGLRALFRAA